MRPEKLLTEDQIEKIRAMLAAGFSQRGCAIRMGMSTTLIRRLVSDLGLNAKTKQSTLAYRQRKARGTDFHLRDVPLSDTYVLSVGADRYLKRLREVHGKAHEQGSGNDS